MNYRNNEMKENEIVLRMINVSKSYGGKKVFDDVTYSFGLNQCYLVQGESGIGKSTLLNLLSGYEAPDKGEIVLKEHMEMDYMFQDELLFSNLRVIDNLKLKYYANRRDEEWDDNGFVDKITDVLKKFDIMDLIEKKVSVLSGGERQRVVLTNMVLSEKRVLLLDEPVTRLDEKNREKIISCIEKCLENRLIIIVSHDMLKFSIPIVRLRIQEGKIYEE